MSANVGEIDVILDTCGLTVPCCPHGPALLFIKYNQGGDGTEKQRKFFACSAFRDRKQCRFFQYVDEKISKNKQEERRVVNASSTPQFSHTEFMNRFEKLQQCENSTVAYCHSCDLLLLSDDVANHTDHDIQTSIAKQRLSLPSQLFKPLDDNKTYAQYLFAESAVTFILAALKKLDITHVLCLGAPRIHETILNQNCPESRMESLLLDLDHRYMQIFPPSQFCQYNMFNHHFFNSTEGEKVYENFVVSAEGKRVAVVTDPPFGGMVDALAATMRTILNDCQLDRDDEDPTSPPLLWFFPYFLEKRITDSMPSLHMMDYKVDYENHSLYAGNKHKKGSPVRIFTNLPAKDIPLSTSEGYHWCAKCLRYSARENKHCDKCGTCPSKDGSRYTHCDRCGRCVKPSWIHCGSCDRCQLQDHRCGTQAKSGCHICGETDHKRRYCPRKGELSRKRKGEMSKGPQPNRNKRKKGKFEHHLKR